MMKRREMCRMNAEQSAGRDAEEDAGEKDETQEMMGRENRLVQFADGQESKRFRIPPARTLTLPQKVQVYFACWVISIFLIILRIEAPYLVPYLPTTPTFLVRFDWWDAMRVMRGARGENGESSVRIRTAERRTQSNTVEHSRTNTLDTGHSLDHSETSTQITAKRPHRSPSTVNTHHFGCLNWPGLVTKTEISCN